jgi:hypothetical protein
MKNFKRSFREQFRECKEQGFLGEGPVLDYGRHPGFLPVNPRKRKAILDSGEKGLPLFKCLRFGGVCNSGKKACQELRTLRTK